MKEIKIMSSNVNKFEEIQKRYNAELEKIKSEEVIILYYPRTHLFIIILLGKPSTRFG